MLSTFHHGMSGDKATTLTHALFYPLDEVKRHIARLCELILLSFIFSIILINV